MQKQGENKKWDTLKGQTCPQIKKIKNNLKQFLKKSAQEPKKNGGLRNGSHEKGAWLWKT